MRTGIGLILICIGATCTDSESLLVPFILCGIGCVLTIKKKKTPSSRQAREGAKNKLLQPDYTMGR